MKFSKKYYEAKEMEKYFVTVANHLLSKKEVNPARNTYVANRMKEVDVDNLFVPK
ncbi:hypothetical protein JSY36_03405 [Bacillus sp. H-16]|uniref:hypothetical protein n=1 Tax=Alteribacter salitolerans TaxID=2912333 RepID=UPI001964D19F|nr:hypothetical protein [Alteribacter salitolerans]MBM7094794.1 hypothetical protein [Alteribacter salitolerans]